MPDSPLASFSWLEILNPQVKLGRVRYALFDFDGTISIIRREWERIRYSPKRSSRRYMALRESPSALAASVTFPPVRARAFWTSTFSTSSRVS